MATLIGIRYVGKKTHPVRDTVAGTALVWEDTKQVHFVPEDIAAQLLQHDTVWAADGKKTGKVEPDRVIETPQEPLEADKELPPLVPLDTMSKADMMAYAQSHFGQKIPPQVSEANMRAKIRNWMNSPMATG